MCVCLCVFVCVCLCVCVCVQTVCLSGHVCICKHTNTHTRTHTTRSYGDTLRVSWAAVAELVARLAKLDLLPPALPTSAPSTHISPIRPRPHRKQHLRDVGVVLAHDLLRRPLHRLALDVALAHLPASKGMGERGE